jgi:hypothetical protein
MAENKSSSEITTVDRIVELTTVTTLVCATIYFGNWIGKEVLKVDEYTSGSILFVFIASVAFSAILASFLVFALLTALFKSESVSDWFKRKIDNSTYTFR